MKLSTILGIPHPLATDELTKLDQAFKRYIQLEIPYETVYNAKHSILVKTPLQMAQAVVAGRGGHCVEHSYLLTEVLREHGLLATYCCADHTDFGSKTSSELDYSYVTVSVDEKLYVCDPLYERRCSEVPQHGAILFDRVITRRIAADRIQLLIFDDGGRLQSEDIVHEDFGIEDKIGRFEARYGLFSPFGVIAPFVRQITPVMRSVFYSPAADSLLIREGASSRLISSAELQSVDWISETLKTLIAKQLPKCRAERDAAIQFIKTGKVVPDHSFL